MLILSRRIGEAIYINDDIKVIKASMNDNCSMDCQPPTKSVSWFAQMVREESHMADEIDKEFYDGILRYI